MALRLTAPHALDGAEVVARFGTDPVRGLSAGEAAARLARDGANELRPAPEIAGWRKLLGQMRDPLVVLLLVAVVISFVAWIVEGASGFPYDAAVILVIVVANAVLGLVQEARAEQAVAALQRLTVATTSVVRDGDVVTVPSTELVVGDIVVLHEGDAVSADGRLLDVAGLKTAEAALTGESALSVKTTSVSDADAPIGDRDGMVYAGTAVAAGRGRAVVIATGMDTEVGRIAELLGSTVDEPTPLQVEVAYLGRFLGRVVVLAAAVVVGAILLTSDVRETSDLVDVLLIGVSLAVAAVPEGLPAIISLTLALGVQRMARRRALVKRLSSVETLGSATVICTDKTGTLTRNEMMVRAVVTPDGSFDLTGTGYDPAGSVLAEGVPAGGDELEGVRAVLTAGRLASNARVERARDGSWVAYGDPTEAAVMVAEQKAGGAPSGWPRLERVDELAFTSERKMMSALAVRVTSDGVTSDEATGDEAGSDAFLFTKGAPDVVLARCVAERTAAGERTLDRERVEAILADVDRLALQALRTLGIARGRVTGGEHVLDEEAERDLTWLGVVGIADPPRVGVAQAIATAHDAGIRVIMLTGDHPTTAQRIAAELGIVADDAPGAAAVHASVIERAGGDELADLMRTTSVVARVAPEHKLRIIEALQRDGEIVAMTGDGVNDGPALRKADIGVAMGITGTEVAREAADMVLADDDFSTIVVAVEEGRAIFSNIRKFLRYLLSSNVGELVTMLLGVLLAGVIGLDETGDVIAAPLLATQILWINLVTDTGPALALGIDPPAADLMQRRPRRRGERVIDRTMQLEIAFVGLVMAVVTLVTLDLNLRGGVLGGDGDIVEARTAALTTLVFAQLFNCYNARSGHASALADLGANRLLLAAVSISAALQVAVVEVPFLNDAFTTQGLDLDQWIACVALASAVLWLEELRKLLARRLRRSAGT